MRLELKMLRPEDAAVFARGRPAAPADGGS